MNKILHVYHTLSSVLLPSNALSIKNVLYILIFVYSVNLKLVNYVAT
jgi:hypothetical protein